VEVDEGLTDYSGPSGFVDGIRDFKGGASEPVIHQIHSISGGASISLVVAGGGGWCGGRLWLNFSKIQKMGGKQEHGGKTCIERALL